MTLEDIAKQLSEMRGEISGLRGEVVEMRGEVSGSRGEVNGLRGEFSDLKQTVTDGFNASKTRDEELRDLMKFGLEAREALRETVNDRFDQTDRKFDDQILLLKDVIKQNLTSR